MKTDRSPMRSGVGDQRIIVYADGGAIGNPGPGGWGAIVLINPDDRVAELGGAAPHTTNNRMELTAAIEAMRHVRELEGKVTLYSDSTYVVRGMREWIRAWKKRGWRTTEGADVLNRDLWESLDELVAERVARGAVTWQHVRGHAGIAGNERADEIARAHASGRHTELYRGLLRDYPGGAFSLSEEIEVGGGARSSGKGSGKGKAKAPYSYLSVVDGKPMRHTTWADCERRVKGKSRALFKKATCPADEVAILRAWGFSPDDL